MPSVFAPRKKRLSWPADTGFQNMEALEVLDGSRRPLMIMPRQNVQRYRLPHKIVLVALRDQTGKVYLHKRPSGARIKQPGLWDVSTSGPVLAGEAREDAALRRLAEDLGIRGVSLHEMAVIPPCAETDNTEATLFLAGPTTLPPCLNSAAAEQGMFVDQDELEALARDLPQMIMPALHWVLRAGNVFTGRNKKAGAKNPLLLALEARGPS